MTLALLLVSALVGPDASGMMESDKFVGAWRLVSAEFHAETGERVESPYGNSPQGILMYDAIGTMSVQLTRKDRKPFVIADRMKGTTAEIAAAFESYQAYWGRYTIDERERVVTHHVTQALLPNWAGTEQRRHYKFQDFKLHLRTPPLTIGGRRVTGVLIWEKIKLHRD
jgi:hypothetical protein